MTEIVEGKTIFLERQDLRTLLENGQIDLGDGTFLILKGGGFKKTPIPKFGNAFHSLVSARIGKVYKSAFIVPAERRELKE